MTTAAVNGLGGLEGIISHSSNQDNNENSTAQRPSKKNSLFSKIASYAPYAVAAYYTYDNLKGVMNFINSDSSTSRKDESDGASWYQGAAIGGLKILVGGLIAAGAYNRVQAAYNYYEGEVNKFGMQETHLNGLAYALTYGEQPPANLDFKNQGALYNTVYRTLKILKVDRLDNTEIGSYLFLGVLGMGEKVIKKKSGPEKKLGEQIIDRGKKAQKG